MPGKLDFTGKCPQIRGFDFPVSRAQNKKDILSDVLCFASARRGSNPRPPPWQGGAPPLSHSRIYDVATATIDILHKERSIVNRFFIICKNSKSNSFYSEFSKNNCVSNIFLVHFCCMLELGNFTTRNKRNGRRGVSAV